VFILQIPRRVLNTQITKNCLRKYSPCLQGKRRRVIMFVIIGIFLARNAHRTSSWPRKVTPRPASQNGVRSIKLSRVSRPRRKTRLNGPGQDLLSACFRLNNRMTFTYHLALQSEAQYMFALIDPRASTLIRRSQRV
jgi:hypothetical protein